jgi:hypothetical protein
MNVPDGSEGKRVKCPKCGKVSRVGVPRRRGAADSELKAEQDSQRNRASGTTASLPPVVLLSDANRITAARQYEKVRTGFSAAVAMAPLLQLGAMMLATNWTLATSSFGIPRGLEPEMPAAPMIGFVLILPFAIAAGVSRSRTAVTLLDVAVALAGAVGVFAGLAALGAQSPGGAGWLVLTGLLMLACVAWIETSFDKLTAFLTSHPDVATHVAVKKAIESIRRSKPSVATDMVAFYTRTNRWKGLLGQDGVAFVSDGGEVRYAGRQGLSLAKEGRKRFSKDLSVSLVIGAEKLSVGMAPNHVERVERWQRGEAPVLTDEQERET